MRNIHVKKVLTYWYYFWGNLVSKIMLYTDSGFLYKYYNSWMIKSSEYDVKNWLWKDVN